MTLYIVPVDGDATLEDWRHVHNAIIPTAMLSLDEVRERAGRHRLDIAYLDDELVGCMTVRPPTNGRPAATVIARILPPYRRQGYGSTLYAHGLAQARDLGATVIETVVLAANPEGLQFAEARGFVETRRYTLPGDTIPFIDLRRAR
jgi:GNAT superfamily N-acetyltransferase